MKSLRKLCLHAVLLLSMSVISLSSWAQSDPTGESPVTRTYALTNATVITKPGTELKETTVIIKDGLIQSVGKNASIPANAQVIDASELYVYAAFIDGMSNTGAKRPENPQRPQNLFTPDPPNFYAGITPENSVVEQLDVESSSIASLREAGFAISNTVPYGRMLPGSSALILLNDADHADDIIMKKDAALFAQWVGAPGAYPGNILGMMAKWRNLYRNAVQDKKHSELYAQNPAGMTRPENDRVSQAFFPVIAQQKPVMFNVDGVLDVRRAMRLRDDLGFPLIVAGVEQSWELADELKATNTPIFLSLDLPDEPKASDDEDKSEEMAAMEERRMEFYKIHVAQAAKLQEAGVNFGFAVGSVRSNSIWKNVQTYIDNGLSTDAALAALTTNPASILGISQVVGTVETGKLANVMVTTAPLFTKDAKVKMMFVDGDKYEYEVKERKKAANGGDNSSATTGDPVTGSWTYALITPQGDQGGKMVISKEGSNYSGYLTSDDGSPDTAMNNISFRDSELAFDFSIDAGGQSVQIVVVGTVTGKTYDATATVSFGGQDISMDLTATKDEQ
ncbi:MULTISPECIES: amidohydrolase family protein [Roseivirga]|nr:MULTISPECIES: amidohydrolase family protein [Roseivirga]MBO6659639.1 amidohydrolase family protein [Roseivirga sp.]MBO6907624.1 amidohydrolase family protein [Roseivirga sp.]WPZ09998.1 amidohydrolase family protein [Roseivirga spongicola]